MKKTKRIDVRMTELDYQKLCQFASYFRLSKSKLLLLAFKFSNLDNLKSKSNNKQMLTTLKVINLVHNACKHIESINGYLNKMTTYEGIDVNLHFAKKIRIAMKQATNSLNEIQNKEDDIIDQYES